MNVVITAKPIEWAEPDKDGTGLSWSEDRYGFYIEFDPSEKDGFQYFSAWGEGPEAYHATLADAQAWCQAMADDCAREWVVVTPNTRS